MKKVFLSDIINGWDYRVPHNPVIVKDGNSFEVASGLNTTGPTIDIDIVQTWAGVCLGEDVELDEQSAEALVKMLND